MTTTELEKTLKRTQAERYAGYPGKPGITGQSVPMQALSKGCHGWFRMNWIIVLQILNNADSRHPAWMNSRR